MTILPLIIAPDPILAKVSQPVTVFDDRLRTLLDDMLETMYANQGIGLAAVQVGVHLRAIVMDIAVKDGGRDPIKLVNPEIMTKSAEETVFQEGCLSFPDQFSDVTRPSTVTIRYQDETGSFHTLEADALTATCIQHEIDHINGIVFVDHISKMKRDIILRKLNKAKRLNLISPLPTTAEAEHHDSRM